MIHKNLLSVAAVLALCAGTAQAGDGKLAIRAGRIITNAGADIENGVIVIQGGRITAVGADAEIPWDVPVLDASDLTAFPGLVEAHTNRGMDRANENIDVAPFLSIRDSLDPVNQFFEDAKRWGITTLNVQHGNDCVIGAQGMVVKPVGMTVEEMLVKPRSGVKVSLAPKRGKSRATQLQVLRFTFDDLHHYLADLVEQQKDHADYLRREALYQGRDLEGENAKGRPMQGSAWTVAGLETVPRGEIDEKKEPLLWMVEGKLDVFLWCGAPMDVARGIALAKENGFLERTTFVVANSCWKAADELAASGRPVILTGSLVHTERDYRTGEEVETFVPAVFEEKGIPYAFSSLDSSTQSLWYQAALATGLGLSREKAIAAVTTTPAAILGLSDRIGTLEPGKDGNVVLYSGDPLSVTSWVEHVVIEGEHVYERATDPRVRHLLEGVQPTGTAAEPAATQDAGEPPEGVDEDDPDRAAAGDDEEDD